MSKKPSPSVLRELKKVVAAQEEILERLERLEGVVRNRLEYPPISNPPPFNPLYIPRVEPG